ncbi:transposase family protein [Thalassolituus marinus]|uniref:DDE-type integrase/transposase/recombinase n=1 Tax=Thalassolituus marinus TaxID=671053 RepID=A0ABS7ZS22_9GAMM|nr:transposase family protein [Thalassolituus marinus]MCA6063908.1 DDE-type integrase/transposase/recombinase [Thalassolituus marinus]
MQINQVLQSPTQGQRLRVIGLEPDGYYWVIDIDEEKAWPIHASESELELYEAIPDPYIPPVVEAGSVAEARRDEAFAAISPLLEHHSKLFDKASRNALIKKVLENSSRPRLYITRALRRFWQRGMVPNSLTPDYQNSGARGKRRRNPTTKVGRKRSVSPGQGIVVTEEIADIFRSAIELYYLVGKKVPLSQALTKAHGVLKTRYPTLLPEDLPTQGQFHYFYRANYQKHEVERRRMPARTYNKDVLPLTSTATAFNFGPGARYEIDATIVDIYLVSEKDPERIVGRPTLYLVKDVFSRMIVGMYVGFENASWVTAAMALANAFSSKVEYCAQFGVTITEEMWPSVGIPSSILADRGELLSRQADTLANRFGIQISNSRAYRGDDKGICERHFNTIQSEFKPYARGIVEAVNGKKRSGRRYELDAELSLSAFTEMMIHLVIRHNTTHVVDNYDFARDMPEDLAAVPLELWNWGIKNRTGKLRACDDKLALINLLPSEKATVSEEGIRLRKLTYTCQKALKAGWFDRIKQTRPSEVEVSFDPRNTNLIYVRPNTSSGVIWHAELSDRSRRYQDMTFSEAAQMLVAKGQAEAAAKQRKAFKAPDTQSVIEDIIQRERNKKPKASEKSASERLLGIRDNRRTELADERQRTTLTKAKSSQVKEKPSVIDIRTRKEADISLDYPDLDQILGSDDD